MLNRPFERSMGLRIINEFLKIEIAWSCRTEAKKLHSSSFPNSATILVFSYFNDEMAPAVEEGGTSG